ncbi:galactokinase [Thermus thermamylovorans]|uniref:Galactokinase n=1 Tax=Thermus thermamylovorans TaxID=2509362 RepID=A0A4Q9B7Y3_9DEIN|nr:galactokinase [Thermus thermamylovorans]TBH20947.1 galactokinase [Thermus thermamylovorans]
MGFQEVFGALPEASARAPGRVNLLGEHTDYQEGYVLPTPLPLFAHVEAGRAEGRVEAYSETLKELRTRPLGSPPQGDFLDYLLGVVHALREAGHGVPGARFYVRSEVPIGAGLSSSAALEVAALKALRALYRLPLGDLEVALLAQKAEVAYVGVRCGVMDQMAASLGEVGKALFLDTRTLAHENLPLPPGVRVAVLDLGLGRRLAEAGYNERRQEAEEAARRLGVRALRDVADLCLVESLPPPLDRRARHVVGENLRVLRGVEALRRGDARALGELMTQSHHSLAQDYGVSLPELDALVEAALEAGAYGAKLTGAGFGGAVVALVPEASLAAFREALLARFPGLRIL